MDFFFPFGLDLDLAASCPFFVFSPMEKPFMRSIGATSDSSGRFCVIERVMWPYFFIVPDGFTSLVFRLARFWYHSSKRRRRVQS